MFKEFIVGWVSENTNAFGLHGMILVAQDGEAWEVGANSLNQKSEGTVLNVPVSDSGTLTWAEFGFEIPKKLEDAPQVVIDYAWADPINS